MSLRSCLLRLVVVAGATIGVALVVAITTTRRRAVSVEEHGSGWHKNRLVGAENEKRNLQIVLSDDQPTAPFHGGDRAWSPREDREGPTKHSHHRHPHNDNHHHGHQDHESNDDDDDSGDDNNDDDDGDDKDNKDSDDESESSSQSSSGQEAAAIQSSVVTNLDGVNIGNTITIINIGGGLANSSGSGDSGSNGQPSNGFAVSDTDRSAITSAAVRAFCGSIGCNLSNVKDFLIFPMVASHTKTKKTRAKKRKQRASSRGKKRSPSWKKPALTSLLDLSPVDRSMLALGLKSKTLHDQAKVLAKGLKETKLKLAKVKHQNGELAATDRERLKLDKQLEKQLEVATVSGGHVMEEYMHLHMLMPMRMGCNVDTANWFRR
ncbi:hypothetical protein PC110_g4200 [Phytophthora cactorum]|uniref:Uncharacterized protein n=1 Tax=Phytophthora cactorum TaxID=29920 RepID=A0A329SSL5_9STRA|nr:hypothetical protein PC110_g4200 [Phytophthora cactorum]